MTYRKLLRRVSAAALSAAMIATSAPSIAFAEDYVPEEILTDAAEESCEESDESTSPEAVAAQEEAFEDTSFEADMTEGTYEDLTILDEADLEAFYGQEEDGIILEETVSEEETEANGIIETAETEELFAAEDSTDPEALSGYVLMNIPYAKFYEAELGEGAAAVDAVSSSTLNKPRTGGLAGGSYHKDPAGSDISGVVYPVLVSDMSQLQDYVEVTDETSVTITVTNRGRETTTVYEGKDALFENADYAYYKLTEEPARYKTMNVAEDGSVSFSAVSGRAQTVEGVTGDVTVGAHHADIEIKLQGTTGIDENTQVSGVILTDENGTKYGLRHVANLWRGTEIGWNLNELDLSGRTIKNIRYITKDAVIDYPTEISIGEAGYVLMNIPYAKFYEAELGEGAAAVDAVSSSTLNKPRTGTLAGGSYHKDPAGTDISGVVYPVFVSDIALIQDYVQVTDDTSVSITVTNRGKETTTVYEGIDALFENEDYAYYKLTEKPERYKTMNVAEDGTVSFSAVSGRAQTVEGVTGEVTVGARHADVEIKLSGTAGIDENTQVSGVILTDENGTRYGLRHVANLWRGTEIGWNLNELDLSDRTIKNIRYITKDAVIDYPTEIAVEDALFAEMNVPYEVFYGQITGNEATVKPEVDAFSSATTKKSAYFETGLKNNEQVCYPICYGDEQTLKGVRFPVMISRADYETYNTLADTEDYHCVEMAGRPLYYVKAEVKEGALSFGKISARAKQLDDVTVKLETGSKHGDFMMTVEGTQGVLPEGESTDFAVYGAVLTSSDGKTYVLRHLENLYYKHFNEIAFSTVSETTGKGQTVRPQLFAGLMGNSITAFTYYTNTGVYSISCDVYVPRYLTVTYTDGVDGEELFADVVSNVWEGEATPGFGPEEPTREGYGFYGWDPQADDTVTDNVTYTAVWVSKEDEAVTAIADQIAALPKEPSLEDKEAVENARSAYEALDEQQKAQIPQALVDTLEAAEASVKAAQDAADKKAADAVTNQLNALNEQAGLADKAAVEAAQKAYDALTDEQKALVSKDAVDKLDKAKKSVEKAEKKAAEKAAAGPAVGTTLTSGKLKYAVTASGKKAVNGAAAVTGTVTVTGYANAGSKKSETKVTIPDQITVGGIRYNVTAIGSKAFKGSKKLKNVTVGANITTIGSKAFQNCKKLKKMVIKSSGLKSIGSKAFSKAGSSNYRKLTVKVPKAQLKAYRKLLKKAKLSARAKVKK